LEDTSAENVLVGGAGPFPGENREKMDEATRVKRAPVKKTSWPVGNNRKTPKAEGYART